MLVKNEYFPIFLIMTVSFPLDFHLILFARSDHYCSHSEFERPAWARAVSRPPRSSASQELIRPASLYHRVQSEIFNEIFYETRSNLTVALSLGGLCWVTFNFYTQRF